jgi:NAD-dependent deacetylase
MRAGVTSSSYPQLWDHIDNIGAGNGPAAAHHAIAALPAVTGRTVTVVTQNVDGLHRAAGSTTIELHGARDRALCGNPRCQQTTLRHLCPTDNDGTPRCPHCQARCRPDVVLFGEQLNPTVHENACQAVETAQILIIAGTSLDVAPANLLPRLATSVGATIIWANIDPAPDPTWVPLIGPCDLTLPAVIAHLTDRSGDGTR